MTLACANCASSKLLAYQPYKYGSLEFFDLFPNLGILGCADCGLVQADHAVFDETKLKAFYEAEYRRHDTPKNEYAGVLKVKGFEARADALLRGALPLLAGKAVTTIFELGAGYGYNIKRFGSHFPKAKLYADDPDSNHNLFADIARAPIDEITPDIVILSHVLEHLVRPHEYIRKIVSRLTPGGVLVIEVPNEKHELLTAKGSHQPHITFFTRATLTATLARHAGLRIDRVVSAGPLNNDNNQPRLTADVRIDGWKPLKVVIERRDLDLAGFDFTNERDDDEGSVLRLYAKRAP